MFEKSDKKDTDKQRSSINLDNFSDINQDNIYINNLKEKIQAQEKSPLKKIVQELLEKKEITAKDLLDFSTMIDQEIGKIDFKKPNEQVIQEIYSLSKGIEDGLGILATIILREGSSEIKHDYLLQLAKYYKQKGEGEEDIYKCFKQAESKLTNIRLILNSYDYKSNGDADVLFVKLFEKGRLIQDMFDNPEKDSKRCKNKNISNDSIISISKYIISGTRLFPRGPDRFIDFKTFINQGGNIGEYIYFKDILDGGIQLDGIIEFISHGVNKKYIEDNKISKETIKEMIDFEYDPKIYKFKNMVNKESFSTQIGPTHISELYEEMKYNNGKEIKDKNGLNIIDGLRNFVDSYGSKGLDIKFYDNKNAQSVAYHYPITVKLNTQSPGNIQFFRGILQYIKSTNQNIPSKKEEWELAIGKYEESLKEFIDRGKEEDESVEVVYILMASEAEDHNHAYQPTKDRIKKIQNNIYRNAKIIDISSDILGKDTKTKEEIVKLLEDSLKAGKKTKLLVGLHGGEEGNANYSKGDFLKSDFNNIRMLQEQYPDLLNIEYIACNLEYIRDNKKIYGKTLLNSGKHTSTDLYNFEMTHGATKHFVGKQPIKDENKRLFTDFTRGRNDLYDYNIAIDGNIYLSETIKDKGGILNLARITKEGEQKTLAIEFNDLNDLTTKINKIKQIKGDYYFGNDISYKYNEEKNKNTYCVEEGKKPVDFSNLYEFLAGFDLNSKDSFYPADINGDGTISSNELRIYEMIHYNHSFLSTWYRDKSGKVIRISENSKTNTNNSDV